MSDIAREDTNAAFFPATGANVAIAEVVGELQPIRVTGALQFIIPTPTEAMHMMHKSLVGMERTLNLHTNHLETISNRVMQDIGSIDSIEVLRDIEKMIRKRIDSRVVVDPKYLKTKDAASYIGTDPSFLTKKQGTTFKEGIHFFKPEGSSILRWDLEMLEKWVRTAKNEEEDNEILDKMFL